MSDFNINDIPNFVNHELNTMYPDSPFTVHKQLGYLAYAINILKQFAASVDTEIQKIPQLEKSISDLQNAYNKLVSDISSGKYMDVYINALEQYIDENLQELVSKIVKYVFFGLDEDGYFVAFIPSSWDFLHFDTVVEPESADYGKLILNW